MSDVEFNELAGRIESVSRSFLMLCAHLDRAGTLNGERLSDDLMDASSKIRFPGNHLQATQRALREMSKALEEICNLHRKLDDQG